MARVFCLTSVDAVLIVLGDNWKGAPPFMRGLSDVATATCLVRRTLGSALRGPLGCGVPEWIEGGLIETVALPRTGDSVLRPTLERGGWRPRWAEVIRGWADPAWARQPDRFGGPRVGGTADGPLTLSVGELVRCVDWSATYRLLSSKAAPTEGGRLVRIPSYDELVRCQASAFLYFCRTWRDGTYWPSLVKYVEAECTASPTRKEGPVDGAAALARFRAAFAPDSLVAVENNFRESLRKKQE